MLSRELGNYHDFPSSRRYFTSLYISVLGLSVPVFLPSALLRVLVHKTRPNAAMQVLTPNLRTWKSEWGYSLLFFYEYDVGTRQGLAQSIDRFFADFRPGKVE